MRCLPGRALSSIALVLTLGFTTGASPAPRGAHAKPAGPRVGKVARVAKVAASVETPAPIALSDPDG